MTADGKVSSQITDARFVFCIIRWRGERTRATREVEKSISIIAMLPSSLLKILENGSVW